MLTKLLKYLARALALRNIVRIPLMLLLRKRRVRRPELLLLLLFCDLFIFILYAF